MNLPDPVPVDLAGGIDAALEAVPNAPAVFLVWPEEGAPYLARTTVLRRRLKRLLGERGQASRFLNLRGLARRIEYWPVASRLEASLTHYGLARRHYPEDYDRRIKLSMPSYVRLLGNNPFPRTQVTTRLGSTGLSYGPFRTRASAGQFEHDCLDLFQIRRCPEDLDPSPRHPGCIYGEMSLCLRPCQALVTIEEYASEARRVSEFLSSDGASLIESIAHARDRLSEELRFEEAAREHTRYEKVRQVLSLREELAHDVDRLHGVAVMPSSEAGAAELFVCHAGTWQDRQRFRFTLMEGKSMDQRLRQLLAGMEVVRAGARQRQEHLALLARWYYSSWRDGEWLAYSGDQEIPYRRLVRAISRVLDPRRTTAATADEA